MEVSTDWHKKHQELTPLNRLQHDVKVPKELLVTKWAGWSGEPKGGHHRIEVSHGARHPHATDGELPAGKSS